MSFLPASVSASPCEQQPATPFVRAGQAIGEACTSGIGVEKWHTRGGGEVICAKGITIRPLRGGGGAMLDCGQALGESSSMSWQDSDSTAPSTLALDIEKRARAAHGYVEADVSHLPTRACTQAVQKDVTGACRAWRCCWSVGVTYRRLIVARPPLACEHKVGVGRVLILLPARMFFGHPSAPR